jgi:hypothetical protein
MEKTSKVKNIEFKQEWKGQNGSVFYHNLWLENGDIGQIGAKEKLPAKLAIGSEITYTIETDERGSKIKLVNQKPSFGGSGYKKSPEDQKMIVKQSSLKAAIDYHVAFGGAKSQADVITTAEMFAEWVMKA